MRLRDSLSNPGRPLLALVKGLTEAASGVIPQVVAAEVDPAIATDARDNRMLSPDEVAELVEAYRRGATERSLAERFRAHRHTISRHLQQAGIAKRPMTKMTEQLVARAQELYEAGWGTPKIGRELGVNASTVGKALKRAGVRMRPPVA